MAALIMNNKDLLYVIKPEEQNDHFLTHFSFVRVSRNNNSIFCNTFQGVSCVLVPSHIYPRFFYKTQNRSRLHAQDNTKPTERKPPYFHQYLKIRCQ